VKERYIEEIGAGRMWYLRHPLRTCGVRCNDKEKTAWNQGYSVVDSKGINLYN